MESLSQEDVLTSFCQQLAQRMSNAYGYTPRGTVTVSAPATPRDYPLHMTDPYDIEPDEFLHLHPDKLPKPATPGRLSRVELVRIGRVSPHPALYTEHLEVTRVYGLPIVVGKGEFAEGDIAIYVPLGTQIPPTPELEFVHQNRNWVIQTRRFRGVESCGVLLPTAVFMRLRDTETNELVTATTDCWNCWLDLLVGHDVSAVMNMRNPV